MLVNSLMLILLIISSSILFFINNLYIILGIFVIVSIISIVFKVKLPIYLPFIILLGINFGLNYYFGNLLDALMVTLRLFIMFIMVNLIIKKIGIYNLADTIGNLFKSKTITLIVAISLSFIPIMIKEISEIKKSLITKNCQFNLANLLKRPSVFIVTFFNNLFKRIDDMEKVLLSKGVDE